MPEEGIMLRDKAEFMSAEEVYTIAKTFVGLGVKKIRLTGGEPLIKKAAPEIIRLLSQLDVKLCITTNAVIVDQFIAQFKEAGIRDINVSLDSLIEERFNAISRRSFFNRIVDNIELLIQEGFNVKVNMVVIRGKNEDEIIDFIEWTKTKPIEIQFIEFMPFDGNKWDTTQTYSIAEIVKQATDYYETGLNRIADEPNDTSRNYKVNGYAGSFGIISSITNPFCDSCNRIRLTADGKIKNCLFSNDETDLLTALRNGENITPLIHQSIESKKHKRAGINDFATDKAIYENNRSMTTIGG